MTSADLIVSSLSEIKNNEKLDHYDSDLCADIHSKIDSSLRSNGYSLADREKFAAANLSLMHKWKEVYPSGISKCLNEYFQKNFIWTPKYDPRFPNQNQTKRCFVNFVDYQKCLKVKENETECDYFKQAAKVLCPQQWVEKYNEQLEQGAFPVKI